MKSILLLLFCILSGIAQAQNAWLQRADVPGVTRFQAVSFSIGTKGYVGTGYGCDSVCAFRDDFWEYDPSSDTWTQKADFAGGPRINAVGFAIGTKGYIGTGYGFGTLQDLWQWDQATNLWTQKASYPGGPREAATGFAIGNKGYIGTGDDGSFSWTQDFWEYDPATDSWTQKASFSGPPRWQAVGFSIGTKGYIGTGEDYAGVFYKDFWEWNQATNTWQQKAFFQGTARGAAVGFSIGNKGYIGTGSDYLGSWYMGTQDFWEWNQSTNVWTQKAACGLVTRYEGVGFSIGNKGYIGTGYDEAAFNQARDFWEYSPTVGMDEYAHSVQSSVYPNPLTVSAVLVFSEIVSGNCVIHDLQGKELRSVPVKGQREIKIEKGDLPAGVYLYQLVSQEGILTSGKLVVQ